jgi:hypothetical protein
MMTMRLSLLGGLVGGISSRRSLSTGVVRRGAKFYENPIDAVKDIHPGAKVLVGGE